MTKQEQIQEYLKKPFEIGDEVIFTTNWKETQIILKGKGKKATRSTVEVEKSFSSEAKIIEIGENKIKIELPSYKSIPSKISHEHYQKDVLPEDIQYSTKHIGANPFVEQDWNARITFYQSDIEQVLWRIGYDRRASKFKHETIGEIVIPELDWNPTIITENQEEIEYQRPFVWTLEEKQLLIDSIYNNIEIGKIVVRLRSWNWIDSRIKANKIEHTSFKQIVDGKQRCNAILGFIHNEFPDSYGNYWDDLSSAAQRKLFSFRYVTYGELGETSTDKDVLNTFLCINHTGKPMSPEHLDFVKSLNPKT
jgi:hypothetical protein